MGCGGSVNGVEQSKTQLRAQQAQIHERRQEIDRKDEQIQSETERLMRTVGQLGQEASEREQLGVEMAAVAASHRQELQIQQETLRSEYQDALREQVALEEDEAQKKIDMIESGQEIRDVADEEVQQAEAECRRAVRIEEERSAIAREQLMRVKEEVRLLQEEKDSEEEAAAVTKEAFLAERRAARRQDEVVLAEARSQVSETEALGDASAAMEARNRSLQSQLSEVAFAIGQRYQELSVKDSELDAVKQSVGFVESEMEDLNKQLIVQCGSMERVEASLRYSRDLKEKVRTLRAMLHESHSTVEQLCIALQQECSRREQSEQDLKHQRARTELLLNLLEHFKHRTKFLGPRALAGNESGSTAKLRGNYGVSIEPISSPTELTPAVPG